MRLSPFIISFLCALALKADERVRWLTPVGDNMVLRRDTIAGEPAVPLLAFEITNARGRKPTLTLGGVDVPLKKKDARYEVWTWGKSPPSGAAELVLMAGSRTLPLIEERWTNVVVGKVFLFGDKQGRGALTAMASTNSAQADLRIRLPDQFQWLVASPDWIDPQKNPLPISPDAKFTVSRLLEVGDVLGLILFDLDHSPVSSKNGRRQPDGAKVTGSAWFHEARARSIRSHEAARKDWSNRVAREQRQGRVVPMHDWNPLEPLQVVIEGNLPPYRIDAAFW